MTAKQEVVLNKLRRWLSWAGASGTPQMHKDLRALERAFVEQAQALEAARENLRKWGKA